jgi:hypothetical protein
LSGEKSSFRPDDVVAASSEYEVFARPPVIVVGAIGTGHCVVADPGKDQVVAEATVNEIVSLEPVDRVVAAEAVNEVGKRASSEKIVALVPR